MLAGVNFAAVEEMVNAVNIPVIASGGVRSIDDIHGLKKIEPHGLEGVITGKAIYTGSLDLQEAIAAASG